MNMGQTALSAPVALSSSPVADGRQYGSVFGRRNAEVLCLLCCGSPPRWRRSRFRSRPACARKPIAWLPAADGLRAWYLAAGLGRTRHSVDAVGTRAPIPTARRVWQHNLPRMIMHYPSGDAIVEMIPESAKLNINTASPDDLTRVIYGGLRRSRIDRREIVARDSRLAHRLGQPNCL